MKKPSGMSYRLLQAKVMKMNRSLPLFPEATQDSRFSNAELLELLEFALPATWRSKFDLDGYVPTKHDMARLMRECEAIERNEQQEAKTTNAKKTGKATTTMKDKDKNGKPTSTRTVGRNAKLKYCSEHGPNTTHDSNKCWVLHPNLKPSKFEKNETYGKQGKAMKALLNNTSKSELFNMVLQSQKSGVKTNNTNKASRSSLKGKKKRGSKDSTTSASSDESVQQMECETPIPSDDDTSFSNEEIVKHKKKRIKNLGNASE